jgi:hypothetical protein
VYLASPRPAKYSVPATPVPALPSFICQIPILVSCPAVRATRNISIRCESRLVLNRHKVATWTFDSHFFFFFSIPSASVKQSPALLVLSRQACFFSKPPVRGWYLELLVPQPHHTTRPAQSASFCYGYNPTRLHCQDTFVRPNHRPWLLLAVSLDPIRPRPVFFKRQPYQRQVITPSPRW